MTISLIAPGTPFARSLGLDVPFSDRLLAGSLCGTSVKLTKRSVKRGLAPSAFKNSPTVADASLLCPMLNGLILPVSLPQQFTAIAVVRNHKPLPGKLLPVVCDFGSGSSGPQFVNGNGLGLQAAGGSLSAVAFYQTATGTQQGAFISLDAQNGGFPSFLAATVTDTTTRAHIGAGGALVTAETAVSGRNTTTWTNKAAYAGTDARPSSDSTVDPSYSPEFYAYLLYSPLTTNEVGQVMNSLRDNILARTGLAMN